MTDHTDINNAIRKQCGKKRGVNISHVSNQSLNDWIRRKKTDDQIIEEDKTNAKRRSRLTQAQLLRITELMAEGEGEMTFAQAKTQALAESKTAVGMNELIRSVWRGEPIETGEEDKTK